MLKGSRQDSGGSEVSTKPHTQFIHYHKRLRFYALASASIFVGCILAIALLTAAELVVRSVSDVNFLGNSANLISPERFGISMGNTPDSSAVSFDAEIYTDASGFRVPALHYQYPRDFESSILIIGDSVAFGPGVVEPETFPGILRTQNPRMRVYNAAVIGHSVRDYPNVLAVVLKSVSPSNVLLFLCLNDISSVSAANLEETVNSNAPPHHRPDNFFEKLKNVNLVASFNVFLRDKSKLYLLLKGIVTDPSRRYFLSDYQNYLDRGTVEKQLQPLEAISILLKERNIAFTVVLVPYEFQLRNFRPRLDPVDITLPQRVIGEYLKAKGISFVDTYPDFQALASTQQSKYFLRFDPMHFSSLGHAEMFRILQARGLAAAGKAKPG